MNRRQIVLIYRNQRKTSNPRFKTTYIILFYLKRIDKMMKLSLMTLLSLLLIKSDIKVGSVVLN